MDPTTNLFQIEQVRIRTANGTTDPNDLGSILDLGEEGWEPVFQTSLVGILLDNLLKVAYEEDVVIRSVDLGPLSPQSAAVQRAVDKLMLLTF